MERLRSDSMIGWLFALLAVSARAADPGSLFEVGFEGFEINPDRQRESAVYTLLYAGDTPVNDVHLTALVDDAAGDLIASAAVYEEDARSDWVAPGDTVRLYIPVNEDQKARLLDTGPDGSELTLVFTRFVLRGDDTLKTRAAQFSGDFRAVDTSAVHGGKSAVFDVLYSGDRDIDDISLVVSVLNANGEVVAGKMYTENVPGHRWLEAGGTLRVSVPLETSAARALMESAPETTRLRFELQRITFIDSASGAS